MKKSLLLLLIFYLKLGIVVAQQDSALTDDKKKAIYSRARKATVLSAVLPGAGQVYNKKAWKVPIIYAGLGASAYFFVQNYNDYQFYRTNLIALNDDDATTVNTTPYSTSDLIDLKQGSRNRRDISAVAFVGVYLLNLIDANVDAHLSTFDVSDNLTMRLSPVFPNGQMVAGLSFRIHFKR